MYLWVRLFICPPKFLSSYSSQLSTRARAKQQLQQAEKLKNTLRIEAHSCGLISHVSWRNLPARLDDRQSLLPFRFARTVI